MRSIQSIYYTVPAMHLWNFMPQVPLTCRGSIEHELQMAYIQKKKESRAKKRAAAHNESQTNYSLS